MVELQTFEGRDFGRRCRVPRQVSPYDEGSWDVDETFRRIEFSVSRVRRRQARHKPAGPEGAVPVARGTSKAVPADSRLPMAATVPKGWADVDLPEEAFQRGTPCGAASPRVSGPVDCAANRASGCPSAPLPNTLACACFWVNFGAFNPQSYTLTEIGDSFGGPPLTTSRGLRGTRKAFPDAGGDDWRNPVIQAVRASWRWSTCLRAVGRSSQREPRPSRPSRTRKASQLTGYLIASG